MEPPAKPPSTNSSLFQVFLRLRPPPSPMVQLTQQSLYPSLPPPERWLTVEPATIFQDVQDGDAQSQHKAAPTHITLNPPSDSRKRAVEKFAFTKVFEEQAEQIDIFKGTGIVQLVDGVLGEGRDGLVATLGVTGSGKSHTILGSKTQRGLTQLSLDLLYRSLDRQVLHPADHPSLLASLCATDASEAQIFSAGTFLDNIYGEAAASRGGTPIVVGQSFHFPQKVPIKVPHSGLSRQWSILSLDTRTPALQEVPPAPIAIEQIPKDPPRIPFWKSPFSRATKHKTKWGFPNSLQDPHFTPSASKRRLPQRPSALPQFPDISALNVPVQHNAEYTILVSMYEVYNDRIFDLLTVPTNTKDLRRRHLLFKSTEASPDRKVVAGLRKVVCGTYEEALMVLETGLHERRVAGTGSNSVSSRSHGFFVVDVKRRVKGGMSSLWSGATMTIVDLAGSERARNAKTAGATLAEAGKINESLMYLGQCLQMQSDQSQENGNKSSLVPFRQCKLTELLFSNSFPSSHNHHNYANQPITYQHRNPQRAIMIVTADPVGDFNATSQILRYSALAREVTVPRIPSVSSTILAGLVTTNTSEKLQERQRSGSGSRQSGQAVGADSEMVEMAFSEIARLKEEVEILNVRLAEEVNRRHEAEENWQRAEDQAERVEMEVREECWGEMELKLAEERRRWVAAWGEETDRNEEHLDRKIDILSKGIKIHEDPEDGNTYIQRLDGENDELRRNLENLERELQCRSPTKSKSPKKQARQVPNLGSGSSSAGDEERSVLGSSLFKLNAHVLGDGGRRDGSLGGETEGENDELRATPKKAVVGVMGSGKKIRKLTARKWDLMDEEDLEGYGVY